VVACAAWATLTGCGRSDGLSPADVCGGSTAHVQAVTVHETRSTNQAAMDVAVYCDASADRTVEAGSNNLGVAPKTFAAGSPEVAKFLADLDAVGDVAAIPASPIGQSRCPKSISFGTETTVAARGKTSGDMQCLQEPTAAQMALAADCEILVDEK
jgi:hypothetical protein